MKRRSVLATIGSAATLSIAGRTGVSSSPAPDIDRRVVRLASVDDVPAEHDVELSVEVLQSRINADQTARLGVSTINTGARRALSVSQDMCALFNRNLGGSDHPGGLWLHRAGSSDSIERDGDRWVANRPSDERRVYPAYACLPTVYETGDTVRNEYDLWDDYRVAGYMEPGTYRWEERIRIFRPKEESQGYDEAPLGSFDWGFNVELGIPEDA